MKFNMGRAWDEATAMMAANRELLAIIAGIFVFLPSLIVAIIAPEMVTGPTDMNPDDPMAALTTFYADNWIWIVVLTIVQAIGSLSLFALFRDNRPTVGEAIKTGVATLLPYIAANLILMIGLGTVLGVPVGLLGAAGGPAAGVLVGLVALVVFVYAMIKFSLFAPVMIIDGVLNPVAALQKSWQTTKGNSFRLLGFYALLFAAVIVVAIVFSMISGLFVAMLGTSTIGTLLAGALNGLMGAVWAVLIVAVMSATYRQLSGPSTTSVSELFE